MNTGNRVGGAVRRVVSLFGLCVMCLCSQGAFGQGDGPRDPPPGPAELVVTAECGDEMTPTIYHLAIAGDPKTAGAVGVFYRTTRPISQARVVEVDPPRERFIPPVSNAWTQLALWNERDEDGKLRSSPLSLRFSQEGRTWTATAS